MADYRLVIVTQQKTVFDEKVYSAIFPGEGGSFGVHHSHAPIVAVLAAGPLKIIQGGRERVVKIGGGFVEMRDNVATLLADSLEGL